MNVVRSVLVLSLLPLVLLAGCGPASEAPGDAMTTGKAYQQDPAERDAVLALLQTMKQDALREAFARLPRYRYTRYIRTEQYDAAHHRRAFAEHVTRLDGQENRRVSTVLQADSAGAFDTGMLGRFVAAGHDEHDAATWPEYVLLDDPPYLAPRNREAFGYRFRPDTTLWERATQVIEIHARPGSGDAQSMRRTHLYLDRASGELVAVYLERTEGGLFFSEESRFYLHIRPAPDDGWVPYSARFLTRLRLPLRSPRHFRSVSAFYAYEPVG
ncbi:MAG: hypothetical protein ACE10K_09900 [Rhodothermales bacterium]